MHLFRLLWWGMVEIEKWLGLHISIWQRYLCRFGSPAVEKKAVIWSLKTLSVAPWYLFRTASKKPKKNCESWRGLAETTTFGPVDSERGRTTKGKWMNEREWTRGPYSTKSKNGGAFGDREDLFFRLQQPDFWIESSRNWPQPLT